MISILFKTNCLTEIFIERALQRAREVDDYFKTHGTVIGPLHGLPISLKDQFCLKGLETIMGAQNISCSRSPTPPLNDYLRRLCRLDWACLRLR